MEDVTCVVLYSSNDMTFLWHGPSHSNKLGVIMISHHDIFHIWNLACYGFIMSSWGVQNEKNHHRHQILLIADDKRRMKMEHNFNVGVKLSHLKIGSNSKGQFVNMHIFTPKSCDIFGC